MSVLQLLVARRSLLVDSNLPRGFRSVFLYPKSTRAELASLKQHLSFNVFVYKKMIPHSNAMSSDLKQLTIYPHHHRVAIDG